MSFFRAVIYLLIRSKIYQYIAYQRSQSGRLDMDTIFAIMTEEKGNQKETLKINTSKLKKYFPKNTTPKQMEETIIKLLERELQRKRGRDSR